GTNGRDMGIRVYDQSATVNTMSLVREDKKDKSDLEDLKDSEAEEDSEDEEAFKAEENFVVEDNSDIADADKTESDVKENDNKSDSAITVETTVVTEDINLAPEGCRDYTVSADSINGGIIANNGNNKLYVATITGVQLAEGDNAVDVAGVSDWGLDFIKMAVIKSGDEGKPSGEGDPYLHPEHIIRSDAGVPGYWKDATRIDLNAHDETYYSDNFDQYDPDCGWAWNYDWDADSAQLNVLKSAIANAGEDAFIAEVFSNSPPYFMTNSGCSSGNFDANVDNLRADSYVAFAKYMADVIEHLENVEGIKVQSTTPTNEPYTNYWAANSNKQEGCHFDQGTSQSKIIVELNKQLKERDLDVTISGTDETSIDTQISSYKALSDEAKGIVTR
ncbi:MAG: xylosidase/arabinofuranosidase, partial [Bacteroidaceae bacterium]|nr:xylosidase/arabinofuranosidase [Bacteroidaceae bacterium]